MAPKEDPDHRALQRFLDAQDGVVSRAQVRSCGGGDLLIARKLRRREWARLHEGVYVHHTGPPSWRQRAWAAVLVHEPAALAGASALEVHGVKGHGGGTEDIEVVVDRSRRVDPPAGVRVSQVTDLEAVALLHLSPPRVRVEHAALTVAARARSDDAVVAAVAEVVRLRRTTPERLRAALLDRPKLRHATLLREVLAEVAAGVQSALERRYLRDVERAHGLPVGQRQAPGVGARGRVFRDVAYADHDALVELDGQLGHEGTTDRWSDLERDLLALTDGQVTLRIGWRQVLQPCRLAWIVGAILGLRGWTGTVQTCGPHCSLDQARVA